MKQILRKTLIVLLYLGLITISTKVYATTGKIEKDTVRVRKEATTDSEILTLVSIGDKVEILSEDGEWYQIKFEEKTGYVRKDMLTVEEEKTEETNTSEENEVNENKQEDTTTEEATQTENQENPNVLTVGFKGNVANSVELKLVPTITSSVISTVAENSEITINDIINKWAYIVSGENSGWILISKINIKEEKEEVVEKQEETETVKKEEKVETKAVKKYVSAESLNVRKSPENNAQIINSLRINTQVTVTEVVNSTWSKITYNGKQGYVASKYLSDKKVDISSRNEEVNRAAKQETVKKETTTVQETKSTNTTTENKQETKVEETATKSTENEKASTSSSGVTGSDVVAYAKQFLGYKYVYGGSSPSGFDCSGFTSYVYKHFGYSLNRTSSGQRSDGIAVDKANLKAGDIVCFSGHVGMYIGGGSFIHASNPSGGVKISNLSESYYKSRYITARRIIY